MQRGYCLTGGVVVNKEKYEKTELEIITFQKEDIILTSNLEEDELPMIKGH